MKFIGNDARITDQAQYDFQEIWKFVRPILVIWAAAVWLLLIAIPGIQQVHDLHTALINIPYIVIGAALLGGIYTAHTVPADGHMIGFLGVLLLLAGWM